MHRRTVFMRFAKWTSRTTGHPVTFFLAVVLVLVWLLTGPLFGFSDSWQLVINTGTTILTFLMVFLIQNTQNRDSQAMQIKLDELIRSQENAHNALLDLESLTDQEFFRINEKYQHLARLARQGLRKGEQDLGTPDV